MCLCKYLHIYCTLFSLWSQVLIHLIIFIFTMQAQGWEWRIYMKALDIDVLYAFFPSLFPSQHCLKSGYQKYAIESTLEEVHFQLRSSLQSLTFATKVRISQSVVFLLWMEMLAYIFGAILICPLYIFINGSEITQRTFCKIYCSVALVP